MTNYLHGSERRVRTWTHCSVCTKWTDHETGRPGMPLCLGCDLLDGAIARHRLAELESSMKAMLQQIVSITEERDRFAAQLVEVVKMNKEIAGGEVTSDCNAMTIDLPKMGAA